MQCKHSIVLRLYETVAGTQCVIVRIDGNALCLGYASVAVLVEHKNVQQWGLSNVWLIADAGELLLLLRICDADCRPVVQKLAGRRALCGKFQLIDNFLLDWDWFKCSN